MATSTRASKGAISKQLEKAEQLFQKRVQDFIVAAGAFPSANGSFYPWTLHSRAGDLGLSIHGSYIHCRFEDVKAGFVFTSRHGVYSNEHSGKWNFYYGDGAAALACATVASDFEYCIGKLLDYQPNPQEVAETTRLRRRYAIRWKKDPLYNELRERVAADCQVDEELVQRAIERAFDMSGWADLSMPQFRKQLTKLLRPYRPREARRVRQ